MPHNVPDPTPPSGERNPQPNAPGTDASTRKTNTDRISYLEGRLEASEKAAKKSGLSDPSFIIALAAFIVSITTTAYSIIRERNQTIDSITAQLRTTLNSISELGFKVADAENKYEDSKQAFDDFNNWAGVQNTVLTTQAIHLATELGERAEATDLVTVANRLRQIGRQPDADLLLQKAIPLAKSTTDKVSVEGEYAALLYSEGRVSEGQERFKKAIAYIEMEPGYASNPYFEFQLSFVYTNWAANESISDCKSSLSHIDTAID